MRIGPRGVPEVPMGIDMHSQLRRFLMDLRQSVLNLHPRQTPLTAPTNFIVTPQDRGNLLQFTRSPNADYFEILWSPTNNISGAQVLNITTSNQYVDWIGQVGVKRFYWVRARYYTSPITSTNAGPQAGTTLAAGTAVNYPPPPPPGQQVFDNLRGRVVPNY